jgi:hypothetical protein
LVIGDVNVWKFRSTSRNLAPNVVQPGTVKSPETRRALPTFSRAPVRWISFTQSLPSIWAPVSLRTPTLIWPMFVIVGEPTTVTKAFPCSGSMTSGVPSSFKSTRLAPSSTQESRCCEVIGTV